MSFYTRELKMNTLKSLKQQLKGFSNTSALVVVVDQQVYNINHIVASNHTFNLIHDKDSEVRYMSINKIRRYINIANVFGQHDNDKVNVIINDVQYQIIRIEFYDRFNQVALIIQK